MVLTGLHVLRGASLDLTDTMPAEELIRAVRALAASIPGVAGIEKNYARKTGLRCHVDIHVEVDPGLTVAASHAIAGHVRSRMRAELPWVADVLVHVEPAPGLAPVAEAVRG